jgi:hypothetical protein
MTNQDCVIYDAQDGRKYLKLPKTKERLNIRIPEDAVLKELPVTYKQEDNLRD